MTLDEAVLHACAAVDIKPPKVRKFGAWITTDTLSGKSGKGDGRVIVDESRVTAWNWQTGLKETVRLQDVTTPAERRQIAQRREKDDRERREKAERAAQIATRLVAEAKPSTHPYLANKGFPDEKPLALSAKEIAGIAGDYLVRGERAIIIPARIGQRVTSAQFIWEDGTKKFLFGGEIGSASHRIAKGNDTWHCEGFTTGLSFRLALKSLRRADTVLCCFSAGNVAAVARKTPGRSYIVTDNDKPQPQFDGLGTGEWFARQTGKPYLMPPELGDINDMHQAEGIFAVQRLIADFLRQARPP